MEDYVNWNLCPICQENSGIKLRYAVADDVRKPFSAFSTFLENIKTLWNLCYQLPYKIDENFTPFYLNQRNEKWHKDCYYKYNKQKMKRAHIRKQLQGSAMDDTRMPPK